MSDDVCTCGHYWPSHNQYGCFIKVGSASCDDDYCSCTLRPPALEAAMQEERRQRALTTPCKTHPRYQIKRKPTGPCEACWRRWIKVNP